MTSTDHLRSFETFQKSIRDHAWLMDVVPGAMDVDILIERKGQFLLLEGKAWRDGIVLPYGQHKALYALSKLPQFSVYLVGEDGERLFVADYKGASAPIYLPKKSSSYWPADRFIPTTKELMKVMVKQWWDAASAEEFQ